MKYSEFVGIWRDTISSVIAEGMAMLTDRAQNSGILDELSSRIVQYYYIDAVGIGC